MIFRFFDEKPDGDSCVTHILHYTASMKFNIQKIRKLAESLIFH